MTEQSKIQVGDWASPKDHNGAWYVVAINLDQAWLWGLGVFKLEDLRLVERSRRLEQDD